MCCGLEKNLNYNGFQIKSLTNNIEQLRFLNEWILKSILITRLFFLHHQCHHIPIQSV